MHDCYIDWFMLDEGTQKGLGEETWIQRCSVPSAPRRWTAIATIAALSVAVTTVIGASPPWPDVAIFVLALVAGISTLWSP